jgi:uncharacterized surface protein with fasciclin (FAS1) repeats
MSAALKLVVTNAPDIVDTIQSNGSYSKFLVALKATGLTESLKAAGPFTLFAPSNIAFQKLPTGAFDGLLKPENRDDLVHILKYHTIAGWLGPDELAGKTFKRKSVEGGELSLDGTAGITVNRVRVIGASIEASNGVIHAIDTILVPPRA